MSYFKILTKTEYAVTSVFRLNYTTDDTKAKRIFCSLGYVYLSKSKQRKTRSSTSTPEAKEEALVLSCVLVRSLSIKVSQIPSYPTR